MRLAVVGLLQDAPDGDAVDTLLHDDDAYVRAIARKRLKHA